MRGRGAAAVAAGAGRSARWLAILAIAVAALAPATGGAWQAAQPFVGVTYFDKSITDPRPLHMHVAQIDLRAPGIRFKVSPPGGDREVLRQSTLDFLKQEHAQIAINGHFFLPFPSEDKTAWVIGLAASEGRVFSAFEIPEQSYALVAFAPAINIDRDNHASIVTYDPANADQKHVREKVCVLERRLRLVADRDPRRRHDPCLSRR